MNQSAENQLEAQHKKPHKAAKLYFWTVGLLSLVWLIIFVNSYPEWIQELKEGLSLTPRLQASDDSFYNSRIDPIFEKYCAACHDDNKDKGQLRLDSYRQLTFSGRSEADLTSNENNLLIERMTLPNTDRLAMPPYGRERHSDQELAIIKMWLAKGGSGQLTEDDFPDAPAKAKVIKFKDIDWQKIDVSRAADKQQVEMLQASYPHTIQYIARTSHLLSINFSLHKPRITDSDIAVLAPVDRLIAELNLSNTRVSDESLPLLSSMPKLQEIKLTKTNVTSDALKALLELPNIQKVFADQEIITKSITQKYAEQGVALISVQRR